MNTFTYLKNTDLLIGIFEATVAYNTDNITKRSDNMTENILH